MATSELAGSKRTPSGKVLFLATLIGAVAIIAIAVTVGFASAAAGLAVAVVLDGIWLIWLVVLLYLAGRAISFTHRPGEAATAIILAFLLTPLVLGAPAASLGSSFTSYLSQRISAAPSSGNTGLGQASAPIPSMSTSPEPSSSAPTPGDSTGPVQVGVVTVLDGSDAVQPLARSLDAYFSAINSGNYGQAYGQLTPDEQRKVGSETSYAGGLTSTQDSNVQLRSVDGDPSDAAAHVTFTSTQDAAHGPGGETCTSWSVTYEMTPGSCAGMYCIAGTNGVTHSAC